MTQMVLIVYFKSAEKHKLKTLTQYKVIEKLKTSVRQNDVQHLRENSGWFEAQKWQPHFLPDEEDDRDFYYHSPTTFILWKA